MGPKNSRRSHPGGRRAQERSLARKEAARANARRARISVGIAAALLALLGTYLIAAPSGLANLLSPERLSAFQSKMRLLGICYLIAAAALAIFRRRVARRFEGLVTDFRGAFADLGEVLRADFGPHRAGQRSVAMFLIAAGTLFRGIYLIQPVRYDEAFTFMQYSAWPVIYGISNYSAPNNHPLNTAFAHFSSAYLGVSPWSLRLFAFVTGIAVLPLTYLAGRVMYRRGSALIALGLVAASPVLVEFSANARGYAAVVTLSLIAWIAAAGFRSSAQYRAAASTTIVISAALALFAVPSALYAIGAVYLWLALSIAIGDVDGQRWEAARGLAISAAAVTGISLLLWAPALALTGPGPLIANNDVRSLPLGEFTNGLGRYAGETASLWTRGRPSVVAIILAAAVIASLVLTSRRSKARLPVLPVAIVAAVAGIALQRVLPYARTWLWLLPLFAIVAGDGIAAVAEWIARRIRRDDSSRLARISVASIALIAFAAIALPAFLWKVVPSSGDTGNVPDVPAAVRYLRDDAHLRAGDWIVVTTPADLPFQYYFALEKMDPTFLGGKGKGTQRVFVYVDRESQSLESVLASRQAAAAPGSSARIVKAFPTGDLWEITAGSAPEPVTVGPATA